MAQLTYTTKLSDELELTISSEGIELRNRTTGNYVDITFERFVIVKDRVDKYLDFAEVISVDMEV